MDDRKDARQTDDRQNERQKDDRGRRMVDTKMTEG